MARRPIKIALGMAVVGGGLATAKRSDADILARAGASAAERVSAVAPASTVLAGPLAAFSPAGVLPVAERVRLRLDTDRHLAGARLTVLPGSAPGEVKVRGMAAGHAQRMRALDLAGSTAGVERVIDEIAVPE